MQAGHNATTDGPPRAGSTELVGRIWPAGRTLPTPGVGPKCKADKSTSGLLLMGLPKVLIFRADHWYHW